MPGQTITMTPGQKTSEAITVLDQNGNTVPASAYTVAITVADPTIIQESGPDGFGFYDYQALKVGSTTASATITANPGSGYTGSATLGPDTFNVNPLSLASASNTYSKPA